MTASQSHWHSPPDQKVRQTIANRHWNSESLHPSFNDSGSGAHNAEISSKLDLNAVIVLRRPDQPILPMIMSIRRRFPDHVGARMDAS